VSVLSDPYAILGVSRNAGIDEIKRAFRARARQSHPDSDRGNPQAEEQFKTLLAAYETVAAAWNRRRSKVKESDEAVNTSSETARPATAQEEPHSPVSGDPDKPDNAHGPSEGSSRGFKAKGTDVTYTIAVTVEEAAKGVTHSFDMVTGKKLGVKVPPGVLDGHILRLRGEGMPGMGGCARGDALIEVKVTPHPIFGQQGSDIHVDVPITLAEAVLGGRVDVPTVGGSVTVSVPPGSNTGTMLRLRHKGLPRAKGGCGDQYIKLRVVLPSSPDDEFIQFVKRWQANNPYTVRKP